MFFSPLYDSDTFKIPVISFTLRPGRKFGNNVTFTQGNTQKRATLRLHRDFIWKNILGYEVSITIGIYFKLYNPSS